MSTGLACEADFFAFPALTKSVDRSQGFSLARVIYTWQRLIYNYIPETQMTLVLIGKDLVLEGSTPKIENKRVPGVYYIYILYPKPKS